MMKTLALLATLVIVLIASSGSALAIEWVVGFVSDSADVGTNPLGDSYGKIITLYNKTNPSNMLTGVIGTDNPEPGSDEFYSIYCGASPVFCKDGDVLVLVVNEQDGYYTESIEFEFDISKTNGPYNMQLIKDCMNTDSVLTVETDADVYDQGDDVTITVYFEDDECNPVEGAEIGVHYTDPSAGTGTVCQDETDENGELVCFLGLPEDAEEGTWTIDAAVSGDGYSDTDDFDVYDCDQDGDESERTECGGDDCDDTDPTSYPGADELCDGIDNDCDGVTDEDFTNLGDSCSAGTGACYRTGVYVCTSDMLGTECNAVAGAPSAEICDGVDNDCDGATDEGVCGGGPSGPPSEGTAENYCGNLYCDEDETCETCPRDCGECEPPAEGTQCVPDWSCSDWSECSPEGLQTRTCEDLNECEGAFTEPDTEQTCVYTAPGGEGTQGADITGLVVGDPLMGLYWAAIIVMVIVAAGGIFLWKKK